MLRLSRRIVARLVALLRADPAGFRAGFGALLVSTATGLIAGVTLGSITGTLDRLPGLLLLVPAAVGMRGNVFGALGSRLGTAAHTGAFRLSRRRETLVGQNLEAAVLLSMALALLLAVAAKGFAAAFGVHESISIADFVVVSVIGGLIPIAVVMGITVGITALSVRREWDLDNVTAPVVTAAADTVTLPSLFLATNLVSVDGVTPILAVLCAVAGVVSLVRGMRSRMPMLRSIVRESVSVLFVAGLVSMLAGLTLDGRLEPLLLYPVLLVLVPPLLSLSGSLAGILASRLSSKLHLGLIDPHRFSLRPIAEDVVLVYLLAGAVFTVLGLAAASLGEVLSMATPGWVDVVEATVLAGLLATTLAGLAGYFGAVVTYRLGLDPDNFGIPIVSSASDLLGAIALMLSLVILGLT
ncbi:MAG: magnesium transporter [Acidimicrobiia bacterium]|nr:magnesium transporter [Acidimicrobiia bacterium]